MKQIFPIKHVMGYVLSLVLTIIALSVAYYDLSYATGMVILSVTAIIQACVQLFLFMHVGESDDKHAVYINIIYAIFIALIIVFGTLFTMIWGHAGH
ncbi:cytochrome aa3 quinol oxidase subunit IV [Pradoshia sp.]